MHRAHDRKPVLGFRVANRVTARQQTAGGPHLRVCGGEDLRKHLHRQLLRERGNRQCQQRGSSHREHVVESIRRGDCAEIARVVHHRWEEVEREDERPLVI